MISRPARLSLSEIAREVAREWNQQGKGPSVPPDIDSMSPAEEFAFWNEVERRSAMQDAK
jgi:hypothetical protein